MLLELFWRVPAASEIPNSSILLAMNSRSSSAVIVARSSFSTARDVEAGGYEPCDHPQISRWIYFANASEDSTTMLRPVAVHR